MTPLHFANAFWKELLWLTNIEEQVYVERNVHKSITDVDLTQNAGVLEQT